MGFVVGAQRLPRPREQLPHKGHIALYKLHIQNKRRGFQLFYPHKEISFPFGAVRRANAYQPSQGES